VLTVTFHLPRPATLPQKIRQHVKLPDLDKLVRCVADALTGVLYLDDKQVVDLHARKCYAIYPQGPHAIITLEDAIPPDLGDGSLFD
jgi:Holliday junction resolvase RusA-like endonuclease